MTLTAIQLWNDKSFLEKRLKEQVKYLVALKDQDLTRERFDEKLESAVGVAIRIGRRIRFLEKQERRDSRVAELVAAFL